MPNRPPRPPDSDNPGRHPPAVRPGFRVSVLRAAIAVATAALLATVGASAPARADRALLIGIDDYAHITDLVGSSTDLRNMQAFTQDVWRFAPGDVKVLRDSQATREGILSGIRDWLVAGTRPGDRVLFYYTGHGSLKPDQNGDEPDGFDEALMAYDTRYDESTRKWTGMVIDDEIGVLVDQLGGREVMILIDACYSGTITRGLGGAQRAPQFIKTPHLVEGPRKTRSLTEGMLVRGRPGRSIWSAASSNQEALVDLDAPEKQGVFTRRFIRGVRDRLADADGDGKVTQRELYRYIRSESERYCRSRPTYCRTGLTPTLESARGALDSDVATQFAGGASSDDGSPATTSGSRPSIALQRPEVSDRLREKQSISEWLATRPTPTVSASTANGQGAAAGPSPPSPPSAPPPATAPAPARDGGDLITLLVGRQEVSSTADDSGAGTAPDTDILAMLAPRTAAPAVAPPAGQAVPASIQHAVPASGQPAVPAAGQRPPATITAPVPPTPPRPATSGTTASSDLVALLARPASPGSASAGPQRPVSQSQLLALLSLAEPATTRSAGGSRRVSLSVVAPDRGTAGDSAIVMQPPSDGHVVVFVGRPGQPLQPLTAGPTRVKRGASLSLALPDGSATGGGHILALMTKSRAAAERLLGAARDPVAFLAALDGTLDHDTISASGIMLVPQE